MNLTYIQLTCPACGVRQVFKHFGILFDVVIIRALARAADFAG